VCKQHVAGESLALLYKSKTGKRKTLRDWPWPRPIYPPVGESHPLRQLSHIPCCCFHLALEQVARLQGCEVAGEKVGRRR
jgi:hypothetical protein